MRTPPPAWQRGRQKSKLQASDVAPEPNTETSPEPQPQSIVTPLTEAAIFLVLTVVPGGEDDVRDLLADVSGAQALGRVPDPRGRARLRHRHRLRAVGSAVRGDRRGRPELHPFPGLRGRPAHGAVATPGDLLFHIRAHRLDLCFELAGAAHGPPRRRRRVVDEVHGFRSFDERDLLGFVDGTENPEGQAAVDAVTIGDEEPVVRRRQLRDRPEVRARPGGLGCAHGRRAGAGHRPHQARRHRAARRGEAGQLARRAQHDRGRGRRAAADLRFNMPFGRVGAGEFGTYFIGYARTPARDRADAHQHVHRQPARQPTTASSTSRRRSPAACSSSRLRTSSTIRHRPSRQRARRRQQLSTTTTPKQAPRQRATARSGSAA